MNNKFILSCLLILLSFFAFSQAITQTVKGSVVDRLTRQGLSGASVKISSNDFDQGTSTSESGKFEINSVPTGRYRIQISFTGYSTFDDEILVISGRESIINISLAESTTVLSEVEVGVSRNANEDISGLRSFSIEKTMRIPANFFDPVRMATTYPGVIAANDQANAIIVRGNSPNGLLWRLNGLDIVNPNHLSNAGTLSDKPMANGGGVNILSAQMLDKTDFYTGAFPANYGNALGGIVDMKVREGNHDKLEYTAQASLIGLDVSAEGPINQNHNTSFLANYRYSTVGLLSKLGVDFGGEVIDFQDFSFNLNTRTKKGAALSFFGFGGLSNNTFKEKEQSEWKEDKDHSNIDYKSKTYALGVSYNVPFSRSGLSISVGYSAASQERKMNASTLLQPTDAHLVSDYYSSNKGILSSNIQYEIKIGSKNSWQIGMVTDFLTDDLNTLQHYSTAGFWNYVDGSSQGVLFQPYTSLNIAFASTFKLNAGIRYVRYSYNDTQSLEPRLMLTYQPTTKTSFDFSYGIVSQMQLPLTYLSIGNKNLGFTKAHHVNVSYQHALTDNLKLKSEIYYQRLFDIPVERNPSAFSVINLLEAYVPVTLVNNGTAENYGLNISLEKSFYKANYFMIGGSYYESTYEGSDGIKRDSRFNGKYTFNAMYGKEWKSHRKNRTIGLNTRMLYLGGLRETPINVALSQAFGETIRDESKSYEDKLGDYFRIDLRLSFRKNKPRYTRTFAIDLQNVTGQQNEAYHYYDFTQNKIVTKYQLGLIPVLVYRIDF